MKRLIYVLTPIFFALILHGCASSKIFQTPGAQVGGDQFNPQRFQFVATTARPLRGSSRFLNNRDDVIVSNDTLYSQLPYFGQSTSPPMNRDEAGIFFITKDFKQVSNKRPDGTWEITIDINGQRFVRQFNFTVNTNGSATLHVLSNFRDAISFDGVMREIKE